VLTEKFKSEGKVRIALATIENGQRPNTEHMRRHQLADETNKDLTPEQMAARIRELENRLATGGTLRFKVSEKGAVSTASADFQ